MHGLQQYQSEIPPTSPAAPDWLRRLAGVLALGVGGWLASLPSHAMVELTGISKIAAGGWHTCALTKAGGVKCWGNNSSGQLGDNTTTQRLTPIDVAGLASGVTAIAAGGNHTCALTAGGGVKCWGWNTNGQLGDNTLIDRLTPADVSGLASGVTAIAAGGSHTCALTAAGAVKCWGYNLFGQLGDNTLVNRLTPVDVLGLASGVAAISVGGYHTCALTTAGGMKCWGYNGNGQIGDNTGTNRLTPADVSGLASGTAAITAGIYHTCVLNIAGGVKCWGNNNSGQIGDGTTTQRLTPVNVWNLASGVMAIAAGGWHTCALTAGAGMKCWGSNAYGELGENTATQHFTPVDVSGLTSQVAAITAGANHTCALTTGGEVKCWGYNLSGQLGDNTSASRLMPVEVSGLTGGLTAIAAGVYHTCALNKVGGVKCWGNNDNGQIGDATATQRVTPVEVSGLASGVAAITAGGWHTCALTTTGGVKCWGYNGDGQLGDNTLANHLTPVNVSGLTNGVVAIAAGGSHTCALTTAGGIKCWGYNYSGQLGDNTLTNRLTPVDVSGLAGGVAAIAAGGNHTCALTASSGVKCWGNNAYGQLGDDTTIQRLTPVDVSSLANGVAAIAAGASHTCALTTAGAMKCWGYNYMGQLGDDTSRNLRLTPVEVWGLASGVAAIAAGGVHTCALTTASRVRCWGYNGDGELGDNTTDQRLTPVDVPGLASGSAAIALGQAHTCALTAAGGVKCWGENLYGQLGDSTAGFRSVPAPVLTFYSTATPSGSNDSLSLLANFNIASADAGRTGSYYIAALLATGELFFQIPIGFIKYTGGPIPAFSTDTLTNRSITLLIGANVTPFLGTILFAGYGLSDADLVGNSKYNAIYTVQ